MQLRSGQQLFSARPSRVRRHIPPPCRLLDLPTELRIMIYGYAFGYENIHWTMTYESTPKRGFILALGRVDMYNVITRNWNLRQHRHSLLQTCRQVSEEAFPVFYNQTWFNIGFHQDDMFKSNSAYRLQLTLGKVEVSDGVARMVFRRVGHVRFYFHDEYRVYRYRQQMHILRTLLDSGAGLKSLQVFVDGNMKFTDRGTPDFDRLEAKVLYTERQSLLL